jgi:hypothetical protein
MTIYFWIKETDLAILDRILKEPKSYTLAEPLTIFTEKILPKSRLVSISYSDYIFLEDNDLIKKIF